MNILKKILLNRVLSLGIIIFLFILFLSITKPESFLSRINIFGMLYGISTNMIIAGAMTSLLISGGFDIAVGSVLAMSMMVVSILLKMGVSIPVSIIATLAVGVFLGAIMGYIISYIGINPFIVTLSGWFIIDSLLLIISGGTAISGFPAAFTKIAGLRILNVPMIIIFAFLSMIVYGILMTKNKFFRQNFFIGGNEVAAQLSGINVRKVKLVNYMLTSLMAAVAGIFLASRFNVSIPQAGADTAFQVITAVIIGGAALRGGRGSVPGTFLGLLFVALIRDTIVLHEIKIQWSTAATGAILILVVIIDANTQRIVRKLEQVFQRKLTKRGM